MELVTNALGFTFNEVQYYTGAPRVYRVGYPSVDYVGLAGMCLDFELHPKDTQLVGAEPDVLIENGGRLCYLSHGVGRTHIENIVNMRAQNHGSVFRHGMVTLVIGGVSRGLTHELVRHGTGTAVSQVSSRYVDARRLGFVVPVNIRTNIQAIHAFVLRCDQVLHEYDALVADMVEKGQTRKVARGTARELLPVGLAQVLQMSFTCQAARHFLRMRGNDAADVQIRELAIEMAPIIKDTWPVACSDIIVVEPKGVKIGVVLSEEV